MSLVYQPPSKEELLFAFGHYQASEHFAERYRQRMRKHTARETTKQRLLEVSDDELTRRANYMLIFSIHGRPGDTPQTEVRYYFDWNIVIDNERKRLVTMYIDDTRGVPNAKLFGDTQLRKTIYNLWFKPSRR